MTIWYKNKLFVAIAVFVILIAGWFIFFNKSDEVSLKDVSVALEKHADGVRISGQIECLPYRKPTDNDACVKGIMDAEGRYYALNSTALRGAENTLPKGTQVVATGVYEPADLSNSESSVFLYDGVLVVKTLTRE